MGRVNPFADQDDLNDFQPKQKPKATEEDKAVIEQVAEQTGFVSRQPRTATPAAEPVVRTRRRYTTGRNQQLNIKVTEDAMKRFYAIADRLKLPLGEVFDQALKVFEAQQEK